MGLPQAVGPGRKEVESALQITMVKENLAVAMALWAAAQRGVITGAFLPGQIEFTSFTGQMMAVSTPLEVRDNKDMVRQACPVYTLRQTHHERPPRTYPLMVSPSSGSGQACRTMSLLH